MSKEDHVQGHPEVQAAQAKSDQVGRELEERTRQLIEAARDKLLSSEDIWPKITVSGQTVTVTESFVASDIFTGETEEEAVVFLRALINKAAGRKML